MESNPAELPGTHDAVEGRHAGGDGAGTFSRESFGYTGFVGVADGTGSGCLTVEVTKVENLGGRLKLFVTAINASTAKMDLPIASVSAVDDVRRDYGASTSTSRWPVSIAKNSSVNGFVELDQKAGADSSTLSLTFAGIIGQLAPTGGAVTVTGIPIPK
jgi:hypothetical protein